MLLVFLFGLFEVLSQDNTEFEAGCRLPFYSIAKKRNIDDKCGIEGTGTSRNTDANKLQNAAKNNFCATGRTRDMRVRDFVDLHKKVKNAGISYGNYLAVPKNRSGLQNLGEGNRVRFTGYINHVKYANVSTGESVNCKEKRAWNNDIHIELTERKYTRNKCKRISAEVSPHYRPDAWNVTKLGKVEDYKMKIRLTGHLFFDASHVSCPDHSGDGYRASSWEIHPVYRIEVLVDDQWKDIHEWDERRTPHDEDENS